MTFFFLNCLTVTIMHSNFFLLIERLIFFEQFSLNFFRHLILKKNKFLAVFRYSDNFLLPFYIFQLMTYISKLIKHHFNGHVFVML